MPATDREPLKQFNTKLPPATHSDIDQLAAEYGGKGNVITVAVALLKHSRNASKLLEKSKSKS